MSEKSAAIRTAGKVFDDGTVIDLVRDASASEKLALALYREGVVEMKPEIAHAGRVYAPILIDPTISGNICLPTRAGDQETTRELFTAAHTRLSCHLGQLDACISALVFAVFASWMWPVLPMAPLLSIFAPAGGPTNLVLRMLSLMCRHPVKLTGLRRGDIARLPMSLQPTLLLDEPDLRPAMRVMLESSTQQDARMMGGRGIFGFYGPKILCSRRLPDAALFEVGALRTSLIPVIGQLPPLDKKREREIAEEFQVRFLGYSLRNQSNVQIPSFDVSQFSPPVQDLARAFGAAVVGDDELQQRILPLLSVQDEEIRSDRARTCDAIVVEALLFFVHQGRWSQMRTDSIAGKVRAIYKGRGFDQQPSAETVGWAIRRLGIPSGRIDRAGNGIELNVSTCRLIHMLAQSHGVRAMQGALSDGCRYCRELKAATVKT